MPLKILLGILIIFITCKGNEAKKISPKAVKGVLDLRALRYDCRDLTECVGTSFPSGNHSATESSHVGEPWDFATDGIINLDGEWEFYWKEFFPTEVTPILNDDLRILNSNLPIQNPKFKTCTEPAECVQNYITVPGNWNQFVENGKTVGGQGYATYRLRIILAPNVFLKNDKPITLGLKFLSEGTAYELYANGKLTIEVGKIGKNQEESIPAFLSQVVSILPDKQELELSVTVSNFHYSRGGLWSSIRIGNLTELQKEREKNLLLDFFLFGALLLMGIYHLGLFSLRTKDKSTFYFGVFSVLMAIRVLLTGEQYGYSFLPWSYCLRVEYLTLYLGIPFLLLFVDSIFTNILPKWIRNGIVGFSCVLSIGVIFLSSVNFTETLRVMQVVALIAVVVGVYTMLVACYHKSPGAKSFLAGFIFFSAIIVNDVLFSMQMIYTGFYAPFGFLIFIFSQAFFFSIRSSNAFKQIEELSQTLELKIEERTKSLTKTKQEIEDLNIFTHLINSLYSLDQIFTEISKYFYHKYKISTVWLLLPDEKKELLYIYKVYSYEKLPEEQYNYMMNKKIPMKDDEGGMLFKTFQRKKSLYLSKIPKFEFQIDREFVKALNVKSFLCIPLVRKDECVGILGFSNVGKEMKLSKKEIQRITNLCSGIAGVIDTNHLLQQVQEEKEIMEKQKQEIEKLAESRKRLSVVGQMVAGIVHDIKNPIASIKGFAERLNSDKLKPEKRERNTKMIIQEMDRLSDMVYEILDFSKGQVSLDISSVHLSKYLLEILQFQQTNLEYNSIQAITDFQYEEEVELDIARMRRVIVNLIQNSMEVMYDGKKVYFVKISSRKENEYFVIAIEDNGPGIPTSFETKIFEAFATEGKTKGTGLGLFMSKWIVEAHGGTLSYESKTGAGTTFLIKLPINKKEEETTNEENTNR